MDTVEQRGCDAVLPSGLLKRTTYLLWKLGGRGRRQLVRELAAEDLAVPLPPHRLAYLDVLSCLAEFGPASQKETCLRLGMDGSDIVAVLDDLERAGFVVRRRDERDRRRQLVTVTPAGLQALKRFDQVTIRVEDALLAPLSADDREVLHRLLLRVLTHRSPRSRRPR